MWPAVRLVASSAFHQCSVCCWLLTGSIREQLACLPSSCHPWRKCKSSLGWIAQCVASRSWLVDAGSSSSSSRTRRQDESAVSERSLLVVVVAVGSFLTCKVGA